MPEKSINVPIADVTLQDFSNALDNLNQIAKQLTPETIDDYNYAAIKVKEKLVALAEKGIRMTGDIDETIIVYEEGAPSGEVSIKQLNKYFSQEEIAKIICNLDEWSLYNEDSDENDDLNRFNADEIDSEHMMYNMFLNPLMRGMFPQSGQSFKAPANPKAFELIKDLNEFQQKIYMMENEKNAAKERNYRLKKNVTSLELERAEINEKLTSVSKELDDTKNSYEEKISDLTAKLEQALFNEKNISEELREYKLAVKEAEAQLKSELVAKQAEIDAKNTELEHLNKLLITTEADYEKLSSSFKGRIEEMEKQLKDAVNSSEVKKLKERVSSLQSNLDKATNERDTLQKKYSSLEEDNKASKATAANTEKALRDEVASLKEKEKISHYEMSRLTDLAYKDAKTGVNNHNAFNRDFKAYEINNKLCVSIINICGVKDVNEAHGRKAGDALIKIVADKLIEYFGAETVYKIFGGEFVIIHKEAEYSRICFALSDIQKGLAMEDIKVIYGVANGEYCKSHNELLQTAEKSMDNMRKDKPVIFDPIDSAKQEAKGHAEEIDLNIEDENDGLSDGLANLTEE